MQMHLSNKHRKALTLYEHCTVLIATELNDFLRIQLIKLQPCE
jgi:hypothetical protein